MSYAGLNVIIDVECPSDRVYLVDTAVIFPSVGASRNIREDDVRKAVAVLRLNGAQT